MEVKQKEENPVVKDINTASVAKEHRIKEASHQRSLASVHLCIPAVGLASWLCKAFQGLQVFKASRDFFRPLETFDVAQAVCLVFFVESGVSQVKLTYIRCKTLSTATHTQSQRGKTSSFGLPRPSTPIVHNRCKPIHSTQ